jgi:hypothetical protein
MPIQPAARVEVVARISTLQAKETYLRNVTVRGRAETSHHVRVPVGYYVSRLGSSRPQEAL